MVITDMALLPCKCVICTMNMCSAACVASVYTYGLTCPFNLHTTHCQRLRTQLSGQGTRMQDLARGRRAGHHPSSPLPKTFPWLPWFHAASHLSTFLPLLAPVAASPLEAVPFSGHSPCRLPVCPSSGGLQPDSVLPLQRFLLTTARRQ